MHTSSAGKEASNIIDNDKNDESFEANFRLALWGLLKITEGVYKQEN